LHCAVELSFADRTCWPNEPNKEDRQCGSVGKETMMKRRMEQYQWERSQQLIKEMGAMKEEGGSWHKLLNYRWK